METAAFLIGLVSTFLLCVLCFSSVDSNFEYYQNLVDGATQACVALDSQPKTLDPSYNVTCENGVTINFENLVR